MASAAPSKKDLVHEKDVPAEQPQFDEEGNEIEYEEVTDDEDEADETPSEAAPLPASAAEPRKKGGELAGSVQTPIAKGARPPQNRNAFDSSFTWTRDSFEAVMINIPAMGAEHETTNAKTRENRPDDRFWRAPISFTYNNYRSDIIRLENIPIPYHDGQTYGKTYAYAAFPAWIRDRLQESCKARRPTTIDDATLKSNAEQWWKTINFGADDFGTIVESEDGSGFAALPLSSVFSETKKGVIVTLVVRFFHKVSTMGRKSLDTTDVGKIGIEIIRAYYTDIDVEMPMAPYIPRVKTKVVPSAFKKDIVSESLSKKFKKIGLAP